MASVPQGGWACMSGAVSPGFLPQALLSRCNLFKLALYLALYAVRLS